MATTYNPLFPFGGAPRPIGGSAAPVMTPTMPSFTIGGGSVSPPRAPTPAPVTAPTFGIGGGVKVPASGYSTPFGYRAPTTPTTMPTYSIPIPGTSLFQPTYNDPGGGGGEGSPPIPPPPSPPFDPFGPLGSLLNQWRQGISQGPWYGPSRGPGSTTKRG